MIFFVFAQANLQDPKSFGSVYYNSSVVDAIILTEAIRTAQGKFGNHVINGQEAQWGLEHLDIDDKRLAEIGALNLVPTLKLSATDHEGGGIARVIQWDGERWNTVSDWSTSTCGFRGSRSGGNRVRASHPAADGCHRPRADDQTSPDAAR